MDEQTVKAKEPTPMMNYVYAVAIFLLGGIVMWAITAGVAMANLLSGNLQGIVAVGVVAIMAAGAWNRMHKVMEGG